MVKSNNKVFKNKNKKNCKNFHFFFFLIFKSRKKYVNVCRSSQICTGIILLELTSEGLFIQLQKIFCCWRTLICTTKQQCTMKRPKLQLYTWVGPLFCLQTSYHIYFKVKNSVFSWLDFCYKIKLEDTARYAGLLLTPAEGFGRGFSCPSGKKRAFYAVLAHFLAIFGV